MNLQIRNKQFSKGFTLLEIIVVAALIAMFSGLATFGIQQMLANSKLKAVIGEARQVGTALIFAHQDVGFYPKIGYLMHNKDLINNRFGFERIHTMGFDLSSSKGQFTYNKWNGPYFAASVTRNQLSQRFDGLVTMQLPPDSEPMAWPADQWGNPYVLYLFKYDEVEDTWHFIDNLGEDPDFWGAVVSYGPNRVPGSITEGETFDGLRQYCLYEQPDSRNPIFTALEPEEYTQQREDMYSRAAPRIGIVDPGSDDIIYNIN